MSALAIWTVLRPFLPWVGALIGIVGVYFYGDHRGALRVQTRWLTQIEKDKATMERIQRAADRLLAGSRTKAVLRITTGRKEIDDATAKLPDQATSDRQRVRACIELRRSHPGQPLPAACNSNTP